MTDLIIDNEFKEFLAPLPADKRSELEKNLLCEGIKDPLRTWNGILIDGHNRYEIAKAHGLEFTTVEMEFASRDDVKLWMVSNQFARRDLSTYERSILALKIKPIIAAKADERMKAGVKKDNPSEISHEGSKKQTASESICIIR